MSKDATELMQNARAVPNFSGYLITRDGTLISTRRGNPIVKRTYLCNGYRRVGLTNDDTGRPLQRTIHSLVLETYHGPRPTPQHQGRHLDGNPFNNVDTNLDWGTPNENAADRRRHGRYTDTQPAGEQHHGAKLTETDIVTILRRLADGQEQKVIAADYKVASSTIGKIARGERWKHITLGLNNHISNTPTSRAA